MKKEYDFKKLKRKPTRKISKNLKVAIHVRLDVDVVGWLREESEKTGLAYQTFLNFRLKQLMRGEFDKALTAEEVREIVRQEIKRTAA